MDDPNIQEQENKRTKPLEPPESAAMTELEKAYSSAEKSLEDYISDFESAHNEAKANDKEAQRKSRNMQMIAGISDGLSALANMIGVGHYNAAPMNLTGASPKLANKLEAARLERKNDIKSINDRLDQMRNQQRALALQKGTALADLNAKEVAAAAAQANADREFSANENWRAAQLEMEQKRLENQAAAQKAAAANDDARTAETVRHNKAQESIAQGNVDNDAAGIALREQELAFKREQAEKKLMTDPDEQRRFVQSNIVALRNQLASSMGFNNYDAYLSAKANDKSGMGWFGEGRVARRASNANREKYENASRSNPSTDVLLEALKYPGNLNETQLATLVQMAKEMTGGGSQPTTEDDFDIEQYRVN